MNPFRMYVFVSIIFFLLVGIITRDDLKDTISKKIENIESVEKQFTGYYTLRKMTGNFNSNKIDSLNREIKVRNKNLIALFINSNNKENKKIKRLLKDYALTAIIEVDTVNKTEQLKSILDIESNRTLTQYTKIIKYTQDNLSYKDVVEKKLADGFNIKDTTWLDPISKTDTIMPLSVKDEIKIMGYSDLQLDSLIKKREPADTNKFKSSIWDSKIRKLTYKLHAKEIFYNDPNYVDNTFLKYTSIAMFFIMPFFALILYVFYIRRKVNYFYEMLIFSLHFHTLVFIIFSFFFILEIIFKKNLPNSVMLIPVGLMIIVLFASLRHVFKQSLLKSILKEFLIVITYFIFLSIIFGIILGYSTLIG